MNFSDKVNSIKTDMVNTLTEIVKKSNLTVTRWKGTGGEQYINLSFKIQHENNYCKTEYLALRADGRGGFDLHQDAGCFKGFYISIDTLTLEQLAALTDAIS